MKGGKTLKKKSNLNCLWAFSITAGLLLLVYVLYGLYPLGEKCILYSDMQSQYYPMLTEFYSRVKEGRGLIYSWSTGLGMPFAGNLINYLASPVNLLVLFFPKDNIYTAIALIILIKVSFASGFFTFYVNKSRDTDRIFAVSLGVAYSLCGWFAAYYWDFMWLDAFALFPIVIYGIEKLIDTHKPLTYILSLALTLITSFYIGYMVCIFSVIWFLIYEFFIGKDSMLPVRHKKYYFENLIGCNFVRDGGLFAFSSLIAGGLAAFALVPVFFILTRSSATSDTWPENGELFFRFFDFLVNHLADVEPTFRSKTQDSIPLLPNIYSGILPVILSVFFFISKKPARREKWGFGILLAVMYFSMNINVLNYIWHAFHVPNDLPYRFSFMYSFLLLVISAKAFGNVKDEKIYKYAISALPVVFIALTANKYGVFDVDKSAVIISIVAAVVFCILLTVFKCLGSFRDSVTLFIAFCMIIEVAYSGSGNYDITKKQPEIKEEYESLQTFIEKANEQNDDDKFYRSVLSYELNDGCFGYNGINLFSSMAYESVVKLQDKLGNETNYINSINYACQSPVYNMMHTLRYFGDSGQFSPYISSFGYTKLSDGLFENDYYLPLAFGVNKGLEDWETSETDVVGNQANWFNLASGTDGAFERVKSITVTGEDISLDFDSNTGIINYRKVSGDKGNITVNIENNSADTYYYCVCKKEANSKESTKVCTNSENNKDCETKIYINEEFDDSGKIYVYAYKLNKEKLNEGYEFLNRNLMTIDYFDDTNITGTVTTSKNQIVYTSIPYDEGWKIKIDGKDLPKEDYISLQDAYLCFRAPEGKHFVEFSYELKGLKAGAAISILSVVLLAAYVVVTEKAKKKPKHKAG